MTYLSKVTCKLALAASLLLPSFATATPYTTSVPGTGVSLPEEYPEAGGVAFVLTGANGNIYYQFSDPDGAFRGFNSNGQPTAFRGNPFTINNPLVLDCGFSSCSDYFGGAIARVDIRFSAYDGDTQPGGFDEDDISLILNGFNVGSWSGLTTEITNTNGTQSFGFTTGFGNNTFNTGWFSTTNSALLNNILTTGQTTTQVLDDDPNDNYWDFRRGPSLSGEELRTVAPGYELEKSVVGGATTFSTVGEVITYEYLISNIGSVQISDITVADDKIPNVSCPAPPANTLPEAASGASSPPSLTCTGLYTVTQEDVDNGTLTNIASAEGTPEFGELGTLNDTVTLNGPTQTNSLTLSKSGSPDPFGVAGTNVSYDFTITNTGNTTLSNVVVTDPAIPGLSCTIAEILPLSADNTTNTAMCSGTYQVQQSDVDDFAINGQSLVNNASVTAQAPDGSTVSDSATDTLTGPTANPTLTLEKTALQGSFDEVGDVLTYELSIENTGNVTWPGPPAITDLLTGGATCPAGTVAPGDTVICTASYTVDQDDLDAGEVVNDASAEITVGGETRSAADGATVSADIQPGLAITKQLQAGSPDPYSAIGDELIYEFILENTSNVTINNPQVTDDQVSVTCPSGGIAPGDTVTCTSVAYVIDQDDLDDGSVTNNASASADLVTGGSVSSPSTSLTISADQQPSLDMTKTAPTVAPIDFVDGTEVTYSYEVENTGNVTLAGPISVTDDKIGAPFVCSAGDIAPMSSVICTADYTITATDVANGFVTNLASATADGTTSNTDGETIPQAGTPAITLNKTSSTVSVDSTSDTISYSFEIVNTGDVTIVEADSPITINDPGVSFAACTQPALLYPQGSANTPQSYTCTGTFNGLLQADIDAGSYTNSATVSFPYDPPLGGSSITVSSAPSSVTTPVDITPSFTFEKSTTDDYSNVNDAITYTFTVTNDTVQTISQVVVTDPLIPTLSCTLTNIGPLASQSCMGTYNVDQDDLDAEEVLNLATAVGTSSEGVIITETDDETVAINPAAATRSLSVLKDASTASFTGPNEAVNYTFTVENTGNLTLTNVAVADPDLGLNCVIGTLAPGAIDTSCTGSRTMTQDDVDAGGYTNNASASADGVTPVAVSETVDGPARVASWNFTKTSDAPYSQVGDMVTFRFEVENTGNVTLNNLVVTDTFFDPSLSCSIGSLAPGATDTTCVATYTVDQTDIDAGQITNTADLDGNGIDGAAINDSATEVVSGPTRNASIELTKTEVDASGTFVLNVAEDYTFEVENTGNVTLTNVVFDDPLTGLSCTLPDLLPGDTTTECADTTPLNASYTPDQDDVDAGRVDNTATVDADPLFGLASVSDSDTVSLTGPDQLPLISMAKVPTAGANFTMVGDEIDYDYVITNTGNITLTAEFSVVDDKATVTCPATPAAGIAPLATHTCTATYVVTQADLDAGEVVNLATASISQTVVPSATYPSGVANIASDEETATVSALQQPALEIVKQIRPMTASTYDGPGDLGDASNPNNIIFDFIVTNNGNVTTTNPITIDDLNIPASLTCTSSPLAPGDSVTCSVTWAPEQSDVDNGEFTNSATASTEFDGSTVTTPTPGEATAFAVQRPELTTSKSFVSLTNNTFGIGETATYEFTVTNTGNVTITAPINVDDNYIGTIACGTSDLLPGEFATCTADYVVTSTDLDLGSVTNVATGTNGTTTSLPVSETIPVDVAPALTITKLADVSTFSEVGDPIVYTYTVQNTSTGSILPAFQDPITVQDDKIGAINCPYTGPDLDPGEFATCSATYFVTQADLDAVSAGSSNGFVTNSAYATSTFASQPVVSPPVDVTVTASSDPELTVTKVATNTTDPLADGAAGDTINFEITVENTGNVTISNVIVSDPMLTGLTCTTGVVDPDNIVIEVGDEIVCNGTYVITQDDVDAQTLGNTATAEGATPQGDVVNDDGSTTYPIETADPELTVLKEIAPGSALPGFTDAGQTVEYQITVSNTGNVTFDNISITDSLIPGTCSITTLAPGESDNTCTFSYVVQQSDIDNGEVLNEATATGEPANDPSNPLSFSDDITIDGPDAEPSIGVAKLGTGPLADGNFDTAGQVLSYVYTIANLGNVTLTETPTLTDDKIPAGDITCDPMPALGLAPTETLECTATYTVDQDDVDAGSVTNIADVTMVNEYGGADLEATVTETVESNRSPSFTVTKEADVTTDLMVNEDITYTYTIENTGNTRLFNITLDDQHTSAAGTSALTISGNPITSLDPDTSIQLTATYTVTQDDIDAGVALTNTVTVDAETPPGLDPIEESASESVDVEAADGGLEVIKTIPSIPATLMEGTTLTFTVTVENTGNVTLDAPALTDTVTQINGPIAPAPTNPSASYVSGDTNVDDLLDVGETWTYEVEYDLTQADIDAGGIQNSVTAVADDPQGGSVSDTSDNGAGDGDDPTPVAITPAGSLEVLKTIRSVPATPIVDDTIIYEITVENDGNVTLTAPVLVDTLTRADGSSITLAPSAIYESGDGNGNSSLDVDETWVYRVEHTITQDDIDAGGLNNTVTANANDPNGTTISDVSDNGSGDGDDPTSLTIAEDPSLEATKSLTTPPSAAPMENDIVGFTITVENTGNVTLTAPVLTDTMTRTGGAVVSPAPVPAYDSGDTNNDGLLSVGETWTYALNYTLTQADIDAGGLSNSVLAEAQSPGGTDVDDTSNNGSGAGSSPTPVTLPADPAIESVKTIINSPMIAGDTVTFEILITNTGNVTLTNVGVSSDTLTRADSTPLTLTTAPSFLLNDAGSTPGTLIPGETATFRASYTLIQADIDAGGIANSATVTGEPPAGGAITDDSDDGDDSDGNTVDDPTTFTIVADPSLSIDKRLASGGPTFDTVDQVLTFGFDVENTGNVSIGPISITDPLITDAGGTISCPATILIPGASLTCSGTYEVTQEDIDAGSLTNSATATDGATTSDPDGVTVPAQQNPAMEMVKEAVSVEVDSVVYAGVPSERFVVGAIVTYEYSVTNTGNTTIVDAISVSDNLIPTVTCPALPTGGLLPGAVHVCSATYTITGDDVSLASVTNAATATDGTTSADPVSETIPADGTPALDFVKELVSVTNPDNSVSTTPTFDEVGDTLLYRFTVTNTGALSFAEDVTITDPRLSGPLVCFTPTVADPDLRPGEAITCEATYVATQDDLDEGEIQNSAYAEVPFGTDGTATSPPSTVVTPADPAPAIELSKSVATLPVTTVGQILTYTLEAENTGNQTLSFVSIEDPLLPALACEAATLAPSATLSCSDTYEVTQDDVDAGEIVNTASVSSVDPAGGGVTDDVMLVTDGPDADPSVELIKSSGIEPFGPAGTTIPYTFTVTNTGNVTLTDLTVSDTVNGVSFTCDIASIAPGLSDSTCVFSYTVVQDDVDAGSITNTASVTGEDPFGIEVEDEDTIATEGEVAAPSLIATKTFSQVGDGNPGTVLTYTLEVRNNGNVTLTPVGITDTMTRNDGSSISLDSPFALVSGDSNSDGRIGLSEVWSYEATYTITQNDVNAGGVSNSARIDATAPAGDPVFDVSDNGNDTDGNTDDDPTVFVAPSNPELTVVKSLATGGSAASDTIAFEIALTNTGNVTLSSPTFVDVMTNGDGTDVSAGLSAPELITTGTGTGIAPSETWTYRVTYVLTQADVDSGGLSNSVTVTVSDPFGGDVTDVSDSNDPADGPGDDDATQVTIAPAPGVNFDKFAGEPVRLNETEFEIDFSITLENTGNITLTEVQIVDDLTTYAQAATVVSVSGLTQSGFLGGSVNTGYDGVTDTETLGAGTSISPGETGTVSFTVRIDTSTGAAGTENVTSYTTSEFSSGTLGIAMISPIGASSVEATKTVTPSSAVLGDVVTYTIQIANTGIVNEANLTVIDDMPAGLAFVPGSATVNGSSTPEPTLAGSRLTWTNVALPAGSTSVFTLQARVTDGLGELVNEAYAIGADGELISNIAEATLNIRPEAVFDCTDIIGRVFEDGDYDGYMDGFEDRRDGSITDQTYTAEKFDRPSDPEYERGIPGVRLATVDGTIVTTDEFGRYSIPCASLPAASGSNFTLKLDPTSLPTGFQVTTENPRTMRATAGRMTRMNFGAALANVVEIGLSDAAFVGADVSPALRNGIAGLMSQLQDGPVVLRLNYLVDGEPRETARARLAAVADLIDANWPPNRLDRPVIERQIGEVN